MPNAAKTANTNQKLFICLAVIIDSLGIGIIMPVMPDLIAELTNLTISKAAIWGGYLTFSYAVMQFCFSPLVGGISDRYGRRPVLLISLFVLAVDYLFMGLAPTIWLLFIGRVIAGLGGATFSTAFAYMADISSQQDRAKNFGLVGAAFGFGFIFGPILGGIAGEFGPRAPFFLAASISLANFIYGWFILPESLPKEKQRTLSLTRANPFGAFKQLSKLPDVRWLVIAFFLYELGSFVYPAIWSFYCKEAFKWSAFDIGMSLAFFGIMFTIAQGWLIRYMLPAFGNAGTALIGFSASIVGLTALAFITKGWMVYALMPLSGLSAVINPSLKAMMSNRIAEDAQGELQGVLASSSALTMILTPLIMTQLFSWFTGPQTPFYFPGSPFIMAAIFIALALPPFFKGRNVRPEE